jgi:hypothetical protein
MMRWLHEGIDRLHVAITSRIVPAVFRHGLASPSLHDHIAAVQLQLPPLTTARHYTLTAHTLVGGLVAGFQVRLGPQPELPVLVYHHGIGEMPYDKSFRGIFRRPVPMPAHLVAVRAPYHRTWLDLIPALATLGNFLALCAVSVSLIETLRRYFVARGARGCLVAGTSLGGFLSLLHHLTYGTAESYAPLLAGPDLSHIMLCSHFRRFLAPSALNQAAHLQALLDFRQALLASPTRRVFPLLARYDLDMLYAHHAAGYAASGIPVVTIDRGHITGALAFAALRAHLLTCLRTMAPTSP